MVYEASSFTVCIIDCDVNVKGKCALYFIQVYWESDGEDVVMTGLTVSRSLSSSSYRNQNRATSEFTTKTNLLLLGCHGDVFLLSFFP